MLCQRFESIPKPATIGILTIIAGVLILHAHLRLSIQHQLTIIQHSSKNCDHGTLNPIYNSCECRSLFTIKFCEKNKTRTQTKFLEKFQRKIHLLHEGKNLAINDLYASLSRYLATSNKVYRGQRFIEAIANSSYSSNKENPLMNNIILNIDINLPYVQCKQHAYAPADVKICIKNFNQANRRPLRIAFVGDSSTRAYMETLIQDLNPQFNFSFLSSHVKFNITENFLDKQAKYNIPVSGNGLQLQLFWAPYLHRFSNSERPQVQGAKDILKGWVNNPCASDFPDVIYLSYGTWHLANDARELSVYKYFEGLSSMQQILKKLSMKTKIFFHMTYPIKQWLLYKNHSDAMDVIDHLNQLKYLKFADSNVWMWDSLYPVAFKEINECKAFESLQEVLKTSTPEKWSCNDYLHIGIRTMRTGNNMLWNLICNNLMSREKGFCCST